jgi:hypothetical protein
MTEIPRVDKLVKRNSSYQTIPNNSNMKISQNSLIISNTNN